MSLATLFQEVENLFCPTGVDFHEKEDAFVLKAIVAGVKAKDIDISFGEGSVSIEAKTDSYCYSYRVPLPIHRIDKQATPEAVVEDGILKVTFPKVKVAQPLKIAVKAN